ncbi:hypothetical protein CAPTEDRAFT_191913 [Capitella teleta]|uniref:Uncharacterized protein n=1 Tax=Capitella teleta TaxID=283909 RepID=R7VD98_CAPTE|nr:hypothetical protein CAPTEDRAFT_191913 [Capitella teleta]|eukprot:ELU16609.1 hypothetical protein CAPTEDRAFT_191913 [Capitella teleta]
MKDKTVLDTRAMKILYRVLFTLISFMHCNARTVFKPPSPDALLTIDDITYENGLMCFVVIHHDAAVVRWRMPSNKWINGPDPHGFSSSVKLPSGSTSSLAKSPAPLSTLDEVHVVNYSEEQMAGIFLKTNHAKQTQWSVLKTPPFFTQPNSDGTHSIQLEIEFRTTQFALNEIQVRVFRWVNNARRFQNAECSRLGKCSCQKRELNVTPAAAHVTGQAACSFNVNCPLHPIGISSTCMFVEVKILLLILTQ